MKEEAKEKKIELLVLKIVRGVGEYKEREVGEEVA